MEEKDIMAWNDDLEGPAYNIASFGETPLRVLAGPGTGKSFALKRRVARLLEEGEDPDRILAVTFTRMAAKDIEKEVLSLNSPGVNRVSMGTLHSLCLRLLSKAEVFQYLDRTPRMLMEFEERFLLEDLGVKFGKECNEDIHKRKKRLKAFEAAWAREQNQQPGWPDNKEDQLFQDCLNDWLKFHKSMLVGELIPLALRYLRNNPACFETTFYKHVLVDEYQDLNKAEQDLIDFLASSATLTVIGDEDQSIYEDFRYAHPEGITTFNDTHKGTTDIPLEQCRRCPTTVVALANRFIKINNDRLGHSLLPLDSNNLGEVQIVQWGSFGEEIEGIAEYVSRKIAAGDFVKGQVLILCPARQTGVAIREALISKKCDAHSYYSEEWLKGNPKNIDESKSQQAYTLLSLIANPNDRVSLRCWLGFGSNDLKKSDYARLKDHCDQANISIWQALEQADTLPSSVSLSRKTIARFTELKSRLIEYENYDLDQIFDLLFPKDQLWAVPFHKIKETSSDETSDIKSLLGIIQTTIIHPEVPTNVDHVRIMSLYKAKGLTSDHVIIVGCIEGLIPNNPRAELTVIQRKRYLEEQRRLFYVGLTRCRRSLVLSSSVRVPLPFANKMNIRIIKKDEQFAYTKASSFLDELGPNAPKAIRGDEML